MTRSVQDLPRAIDHRELPPITDLATAVVDVPTGALRRFVDSGTRPWCGEPVTLTAAVSIALWGPIGDLVPVLCGGPRTWTDAVAEQLVGLLPAHCGIAKAARVLDEFVHLGPRGIAARLDMLLGTIIFGVVGAADPRLRDMCPWYPLVAWRR